jgi:hypothetical protein
MTVGATSFEGLRDRRGWVIYFTGLIAGRRSDVGDPHVFL